MERDYEKELNENALYQFLRSNNGCQIYWLSQDSDGEISAVFRSNGSSVYYYWKNGTYQRYEMSTDSCRQHNSKNLIDDMLKITRVERRFEDKWIPVWTSAEGFVQTDFHNFVYIDKRFYTFKELEQIISEVKSLKKKGCKFKSILSIRHTKV